MQMIRTSRSASMRQHARTSSFNLWSKAVRHWLFGYFPYQHPWILAEDAFSIQSSSNSFSRNARSCRHPCAGEPFASGRHGGRRVAEHSQNGLHRYTCCLTGNWLTRRIGGTEISPSDCKMSFLFFFLTKWGIIIVSHTCWAFSFNFGTVHERKTHALCIQSITC